MEQPWGEHGEAVEHPSGQAWWRWWSIPADERMGEHGGASQWASMVEHPSR